MMELDWTVALRGLALFVATAMTGGQARPVAAAAAAPEQLTPEYVVWPHGLPAAGAASKVHFKSHDWALAHREKSGEVENHETRGIVMIIESGEATLVCGNDVVDLKRTAPDETRGSSIRGGVSRKVEPGDVINMPAGLPHQFLLEPGKQLTYIDVVIPAAR